MQHSPASIDVMIQLGGNDHCQQLQVSAMSSPVSSSLQAEAYGLLLATMIADTPRTAVLHGLFGTCISSNDEFHIQRHMSLEHKAHYCFYSSVAIFYPHQGITHNPHYLFLKTATIPTYYGISIAIPRYIAMQLPSSS